MQNWENGMAVDGIYLGMEGMKDTFECSKYQSRLSTI